MQYWMITTIPLCDNCFLVVIIQWEKFQRLTYFSINKSVTRKWVFESKCLNLELAPVCSMFVNYCNKGYQANHVRNRSQLYHSSHKISLLLTFVLGFALDLCRLVPIMLLKLPIMLWSNAPEFCLLCSNYTPQIRHFLSLLLLKWWNYEYHQSF